MLFENKNIKKRLMEAKLNRLVEKYSRLEQVTIKRYLLALEHKNLPEKELEIMHEDINKYMEIKKDLSELRKLYFTP